MGNLIRYTGRLLRFNGRLLGLSDGEDNPVIPVNVITYDGNTITYNGDNVTYTE